MKKFFILTSLLFISNFLIAQSITFSDAAPLPEGKSALTSANDGENIYLVNGFANTNSYTEEVYKYDIDENTWSELPVSTIAKRYASAAVVNNKLYIFNGSLDGTVDLNNQVEVIDLADNSLSLSTNHPAPSRASGVSVWGNKIYAFGGLIAPNIYTDAVYEFDTETEEWTAITNMPVALETKGEIINGKLYVFGGYNGSVSERIDVYNLSTNEWEYEGVMPSGISAHTTAIVGSEIYLLGDFVNQTFTASFDTETNTFQVLESNLIARRHAAAEGVNGKLYVMGGNTQSNISSSITSVQVSTIITSNSKVEDVSLRVFPNPATDLLQFEAALESIKIYHINGQLVETISGKLNQINVSDLESGTYILVGLLDNKNVKIKWTKI